MNEDNRDVRNYYIAVVLSVLMVAFLAVGGLGIYRMGKLAGDVEENLKAHRTADQMNVAQLDQTLERISVIIAQTHQKQLDEIEELVSGRAP